MCIVFHAPMAGNHALSQHRTEAVTKVWGHYNDAQSCGNELTPLHAPAKACLSSCLFVSTLLNIIRKDRSHPVLLGIA